jgi:hypothetical protein
VSVTALQAQAFARGIDAIAADIGRLRRRLVGDEYALHLLCRIATKVEGFDAFLQPTAAEIYRANLAFSGDEQESIDAALEDVDSRARHFRALLGEKAA